MAMMCGTGSCIRISGGSCLAVAWLLLGILRPAWSQAEQAGAEFHATVDRSRASQSEPIQLKLILTSSGSLNHVPSPTLDLTDFDAFGPSLSTRVELVNGHSVFSRELVYTLYGRKFGRFRIGPAKIEFGGTTLSAEAIDVEIVRRNQQSGRRTAAGDDDQQAVDDVLFVRAVAERDTAYVGQQVVVRFELCYRFNLRDVGFAEIPTFTGFWAKELFVAQRLAPNQEVINGVAFNVAPLRRVALFPTSSGTHTIEPLVVSCSVPQGRGRGSLLDA